MKKLTVKHEGAKLNGPVTLRLFHVAVLERNSDALGARWPHDGLFELPSGVTVNLLPGDVVMVSDIDALVDEEPTSSPPDEKTPAARPSAKSKKG